LANPVLSAVLSGQRKILLSWTYGANADFQVFWKSNVPAGQEYVLLATTNAFSYTTADLEPSKTYDFYVRANVGATFFYSNVVELFVSCGKGVVLSPDPPPSPPAQLVFSFIRPLYSDGSFVTNPSYAIDADENTYALVQANDVGVILLYTSNIPPYSGPLIWKLDVELSMQGAGDGGLFVYTNDGPWPSGPPAYTSNVGFSRTTLSIPMMAEPYASNYLNISISVNRGYPLATVSVKIYDVRLEIWS
jgi:hypothetical protein